MRKIAVVGAGQAGLQLALALLAQGQDVIVVSNLTAQEVRRGRITSSQCMFSRARRHEQALGLDLWDRACPPIEAVAFNLASPAGTRSASWAGRLEAPAQSIDQRLKLSTWLERFEARGGEVRTVEADVAALEGLSRECDLVVVASGKGKIGQLFERDLAHSPFDRPMRALGVLYLDGLRARADGAAVDFTLIPGVGECFDFPALSLNGPCDIVVFEGVPGGPMDVWNPDASPDAFLETGLNLLRTFAPWTFERCGAVRLTDPLGALVGRLTPVVRKGVAWLPSGRPVLGLADAVCLNDPIVGQGANSAAKAAALYAHRILAHGASPFDAAWMQATFDAFWDYARHVTRWSNALLRPAPPHVAALLKAAAGKPALAAWIANGFDDPPALVPDFLDPGAVARRIAEP